MAGRPRTPGFKLRVFTDAPTALDASLENHGWCTIRVDLSNWTEREKEILRANIDARGRLIDGETKKPIPCVPTPEGVREALSED